MKEAVQRWLKGVESLRGVLACGICFPDKSILSRSWTEGFTESALFEACQRVHETFQSVQANRFAAAHMRWVFDQALVYGEWRSDGVCLGVFTSKDAASLDFPGLQKLVAAFHAL